MCKKKIIPKLSRYEKVLYVKGSKILGTTFFVSQVHDYSSLDSLVPSVEEKPVSWVLLLSISFIYCNSFLAWVNLNIYIQGPDPGIDFLVDDMRLEEIPEVDTWREDADQSIEQIRKTNFTLR